MKSASEFKITKVLVDNGLDEQREFCDTKDAMTLFGFNSTIQDFIFRICASILHMGELEFGGSDKASITNIDEIKIISSLLKLNEESLVKILTTKTIKVEKQSIEKALTKQQAENLRDSVCRDIYSRLFDHIIDLINQSLSPTKEDPEKCLFLGVLDIFGFENFKVNSFEQFCINYANEVFYLIYFNFYYLIYFI